MSSITDASLACSASEPLLTGWLAVWLAADSRLPGWSAPFWPARLRFNSVWMASDSEAKPRAADPSGGALDGLGERRFVSGELLQDEEPGIDHHHRVVDVGSLIALDQVDGRAAGQLALVGFGHRFESQRDHADLAQRVERRLGAARWQRLRSAHQTERSERLLGAVVGTVRSSGFRSVTGLPFLSRTIRSSRTSSTVVLTVVPVLCCASAGNGASAAAASSAIDRTPMSHEPSSIPHHFSRFSRRLNSASSRAASSFRPSRE